jgi:hypothetical protein
VGRQQRGELKVGLPNIGPLELMIIIYAGFIIACAYLAPRKGLPRWLGALIGLLAFVGLISMLLLKDVARGVCADCGTATSAHPSLNCQTYIPSATTVS